MRVLLTGEQRGPLAASTVLLGTIAVTAVLVIEDRGLSRIAPILACIVILAVWSTPLTRWRNLLAGLILVILFIPIKRYELPGNLPFQLEPYRVVVAALALVWGLSLLADKKVRLRRTSLDLPLMAVLLTTLVSDLVNPGRVGPLSTDVLKAQTFFVSFFVVFYVIVSLVTTRVDLYFLVRLLATGGAVVAVAAIIERRTGFNVFNHLHSIFPFLRFEGAGDVLRAGRLRVLASSQHPIALSVLFVLLLPLVLYLARVRSRKWLLVAAIYIIAIFATASRTGIVGLLVLGVCYLCFQPRAVLGAWPFAIPLLAAVHVAAPGALGTMRAILTPSYLVSSQSDVVAGDAAYASGRLTDFGPAISEWSHKPLFGEGYSTRVVTGPTANAPLLNDQWLDTLLETGYLGVVAWIWLFIRSFRRLGRAAASEGDTDDGWLLTGLLGAIAAFAVTNWFYDTLSFIQNVFILFILLGLASALLNIRTREGRRAVASNIRSLPDTELT